MKSYSLLEHLSVDIAKVAADYYMLGLYFKSHYCS
jgi:hypothetical protein